MGDRQSPIPRPGLLRLIRGIAGGEVLKIMEVYSGKVHLCFIFRRMRTGVTRMGSDVRHGIRSRNCRPVFARLLPA